MTIQRAGIDYRELVKDDRVHGRVYTDPHIFEEELEKIFYSTWIYVGHESEVSEPGDYCLKRIGRQSVILCRDEDCQVHLLMNRCRHRANAVCQSERGNANFFRCAYHGWTYRNSGELVGVPYRDRYDESFKKEEMGLTKVPYVESYRGFIFASLRNPGVSLREHLGEPVLREIDYLCDLSPLGEIELRAGVQKARYRGNWKFQAENTVDGYHARFVHQSFADIRRRFRGMSGSFATRGWAIDLGGGHSRLWDEGYGLRLPDVPWAMEYREALERAHGKERSNDVLRHGGTHTTIFPNLALLQHVRVIYPISVGETEVYFHVIRWKGAPAEFNEWMIRRFEDFFGSTGMGNSDDLEMFERNQIGLSAQVDPWLVLSRGFGREERHGEQELWGERSDETPQRAFWRRYREVMSRQ
jgi:fatty-acyl-CoA synthase